MDNKLLILTEAGGSVGFGHLMRCSSIADVSGGDLLVNKFGDFPRHDSTNRTDWLNSTETLFSDYPPSTPILVDSYIAEREVYCKLSEHFHSVAVIDDYCRLNYPVDLIINPGIKLPAYDNQDAKIYGGNQYIILRNEIITHERKKDYSSCLELLILFGASDVRYMYEKIIPNIIGRDFHITVVTANENNRKILSEQFSHSDLTFVGCLDAAEIADVMVKSDLAISAGGQTLNELAYFGIPTIAICISDDQKFNVEGYFDNGFLYDDLNVMMPNLCELIIERLELFKSIEIREKAGEIGKLLVDGKGVKNINNILGAMSQYV